MSCDGLTMYEKIKKGGSMVVTDQAKVQHLPYHLSQRWGTTRTLCGKVGFFRGNRTEHFALPLCRECERRSIRFTGLARYWYDTLKSRITSRGFSVST